MIDGYVAVELLSISVFCWTIESNYYFLLFGFISNIFGTLIYVILVDYYLSVRYLFRRKAPVIFLVIHPN